MTLAELLRSSGVGAGEVVAALGSGMAAQPVAGVRGIGSGLAALLRGKDFGPAARAAIDTTQDALTYQPKSDIGQRGLRNVDAAIKTVTDPVYEHVIDPVGMVSPVAGAALSAGFEVGPGGRKPRVKAAAPAFDPYPRIHPNAPQQLIPGLEPLTPEQVAAVTADQLRAARSNASFTERGVEYTHRPDIGGYRVTREEAPNTEGAIVRTSDGPGRFDSYSVDPQGGFSNHEALRRRGVTEIGTRMALKDEAVGDAMQNARMAQRNVGLDEKAVAEAEIQQLRGQRDADPMDFAGAVDREQRILDLKRNQPIVDGDRIYRAYGESGAPGQYAVDTPEGGQSSPQYYGDSNIVAPHRERYDAQRALLVDAMRGEARYADFLNPETPTAPQPSWAQDLTRPSDNNAAGASWWHEKLGLKRGPIEPDAMNREAVAEFLRQAKGEEGMFRLGLMPENARTLEDFARVYGDRSGKRIDVNRTDGDLDSYYDSDASSEYIEKEKTHGRGEVMRDSRGDYIEYEKEHARGDVPMYDEDGNVKKVKVGLDEKTGEKIKEKRVAEGGEPLRDTYGDVQYAFEKSRGGEQVYDERGNPKTKKVENPDYESPPEGGNVELRIGNSSISLHDYDGGSPSVDALNASRGGSGHGELLYQTLLSDAVRNGYDISGNSLTGDNVYRLLSNTLSNYARTGENPRDVRGTASGKAPPARGQAEGPELWRAEAEEAKSRIRGRGGDPDRLMFDGENFFIDGNPVEKGDIKAHLDTLSPNFKSSKVGERSLMRMAIFDWLRRASPEDAKVAATGWNKGNIFTGVGAGALGLSSMLRDDEPQDPAATQ